MSDDERDIQNKDQVKSTKKRKAYNKQSNNTSTSKNWKSLFGDFQLDNMEGNEYIDQNFPDLCGVGRKRKYAASKSTAAPAVINNTAPVNLKANVSLGSNTLPLPSKINESCRTSVVEKSSLKERHQQDMLQIQQDHGKPS